MGHAKTNSHYCNFCSGRNSADREHPGSTETCGENCASALLQRSKDACGEDWTSREAENAACPYSQDAEDKVSYALGANLGMNLHSQCVEVDTAIVLRGLKDALAGGKLLLTDEEARAALTQLQTDLRTKQMDVNKKAGADFLEANKAKEGVVALPSGLQYKILTEGTGPKPSPTDTVSCNYRGTLLNGTEFDSSYKRGQPASFPVNGVIKGWTEALQLMPVGSKWQLFIPSDLAYGDRGADPRSGIGPGAI